MTGALSKYVHCSAFMTGVTTLTLQLSDLHSVGTLIDLAIKDKHKELEPHTDRRYGNGELLSHYSKIGALPIWARHYRS